MSARLYVIRGSHACRAGMLMLDHKGFEYETVNLLTGWHAAAVRLRGFPGQTVPALQANGTKVQTNPKLARWLDEQRPDPPLFPADPEKRRAVEEAERFADEQLQMDARRTTFAANLGQGLINDGQDGPLGPLLTRNVTHRRMIAWTAGRFRFNVNEETARELMDRFPKDLDRIDGYIEAGVLNGEELNAADFQTAPSLALMTYRADLKSEIESRPAGRLVERVFATSPPSPARP